MGTNIRWADDVDRDRQRDRKKVRHKRTWGRGGRRLAILLVLLAAAAVGSGCVGGDACVVTDYLGALRAPPPDVADAEAAGGKLVSNLVALAAAFGAAVFVLLMAVWVVRGFSADELD